MPERLPWLEGLVACATSLEAAAARRALAERGVRLRSIPAGRARAAWNAVLDGSRTVAVVVTGAGPEAARSAAGYWARQARVLVVLSAGPGTGVVAEPAVALDGDDALSAWARTALRPGDPPAAAVTIASAAVSPGSPEALASLAGAGVGAVDGEGDSWREAGRLLGTPTLAVRALVRLPELPERLLRLDAGAGGRTTWRTALDVLLHPGDRRRLRDAHRSRLEMTLPAARCALAACVGPA